LAWGGGGRGNSTRHGVVQMAKKMGKTNPNERKEKEGTQRLRNK